MNKEEAEGIPKMKLELSQLADIIESGLETLGESYSAMTNPLNHIVTFGAPWVYGASIGLNGKGIKVFQIERKEEQTLDTDIRILRLCLVEKE